MTNVPFPQANDLGKILILICKFENYSTRDLLELLNLGSPRQLDYYFNAAIFLGLLKIKNNKKVHTNDSRIIVNELPNFREKRFILFLLKNKLIKSIVFNYSDKNIIDILQDYDSFKNLSESTKNRRINTIRKWVKWLNKNI
tara:strand:+ start:558 stop:983 length:426 start_codon:yes stop_codon:yes gene_type:complete